MLEYEIDQSTGNKVYTIPSKTNWQLIINVLKSLQSQVDNINDFPKEWTNNSEDIKQQGKIYYYDNNFWMCEVTNQDTEWNDSKYIKMGDELSLYDEDKIKSLIGLSEEELETLSKIISDSEIRLDKTFSSSKIYTDIQGAIDTSKQYTLDQFAKITKASYKFATTIDEMTDTTVIYLLQNSDTFDMYVKEEGSEPKRIGNTKIDLSEYAKLTDLEAYTKKTDADAKYSTIASFNNHVSDSVAHLTQTERNKIITKDNVVTTISSSCTDDQYPTAKAVYDVSNVKIINYTSQIVKNTANVQNLWSTSIKKIGNIVTFSINITTNDINSFKAELGTLPEAVRPDENINLNLISNLGNNCYVWVDSTGKFGFTLMNSTKTWAKGDGCRMYFSYVVSK